LVLEKSFLFNKFKFSFIDKNKEKTDENIKREKLPLYTFKSGATYEGEWLTGMRDGIGTHIWPDGAKYQGIFFRILSQIIFITKKGEWKNNKAHGKGKFYHIDGDIFEGFYLNLLK